MEPAKATFKRRERFIPNPKLRWRDQLRARSKEQVSVLTIDTFMRIMSKVRHLMMASGLAAASWTAVVLHRFGAGQTTTRHDTVHCLPSTAFFKQSLLPTRAIGGYKSRFLGSPFAYFACFVVINSPSFLGYPALCARTHLTFCMGGQPGGTARRRAAIRTKQSCAPCGLKNLSSNT